MMESSPKLPKMVLRIPTTVMIAGRLTAMNALALQFLGPRAQNWRDLKVADAPGADKQY
jgi:hypothetical protein